MRSVAARVAVSVAARLAPSVAIGVLVIKGKRAPARIGALGVCGLSLLGKAAARRVGPLPIGRQAEGEAGGARQPRRIGVGIAPADLDHGTIGDRILVDDKTGLGLNAALIVGGGDLVAHDAQPAGDLNGHQWRAGGLPIAPEVAGVAIAKGPGSELNEVGERDRRLRRPQAACGCGGRTSEQHDEEGKRPEGACAAGV